MALKYQPRRRRSTRSFGDFGVPFCRELETPLADLKALLDSDLGKSHAADLDVQTGQRVYDDLSGYVVFIPGIGNDCSKATTEANATVTSLRAYLAQFGETPPPLRPNQDNTPSEYGIPSWVPFVLVGGVVAYYLNLLKGVFPRSKR